MLKKIVMVKKISSLFEVGDSDVILAEVLPNFIFYRVTSEFLPGDLIQISREKLEPQIKKVKILSED